MKQSNKGFICEICGQPDMVASKVILEANYGSVNDGERLELHICADCIDELFSFIQNKRTTAKEVTQ